MGATGRRGGWGVFVLLPVIASCGSRPVRDHAPYPDTDAGMDADTDTDTGSFDPCAILDGDGDGYLSTECGGHDCHDDDARINPGAEDTVGDGIDENCDGLDGVDADHDRHASVESGGDDCDDADPDRNPGAVDGVGWSVEVVDDSSPSEPRPWLSVDAAGAAHLSYWTNGYRDRDGDGYFEEEWNVIRYATNADGAWAIEDATRESPFNYHTPNVLDADGSVHILYASRYSVWHAANSSGAWESGVVDPDAETGDLSLGIDAWGTLHASYLDRGGSALRYATPSRGLWTIVSIDSVRHDRGYTSLALDGSGRVHLAYLTEPPGGIRYATKTGGDWAIETVDEEARGAPTTAIDPEGRVRIAYRRFHDLEDQIVLATRADGEWSFEVVATAPYFQLDAPGSLAFDETGVAHLGFVRYAGEEARGNARWDLTYLSNRGGDWQEELVVPGVIIERPALALDGEGGVHMSFYRPGVYYARRTEEPPDGIDQNCDGVDGVDADGDGHASVATGGDDCDDGDPDVHEGCE